MAAETKPKQKTAQRVREIISVFRQYDVLKSLSNQINGAQVRRAFETLGPTFIKIGQMLSTRPDIVSQPFADELAKLQDNVTEDPFKVVQKTLTQDLGPDIMTHFTDFEVQPIASASMGQVHLARLKSGIRVAVKIQHPGIKTTILTDLKILGRLVRMINWLPSSGVIDPKEIFQQFKKALEMELDSELEAKNTQKFYELNNGEGVFRVPRVFLDYCSARVITTEYMSGQSLNKFLQQADEGPVTKQRQNIANDIVANFMKQVFEDGFFHADPHPGNILIQPTETDFSDFGADSLPQPLNRTNQHANYQLVYLDFGMMGTLDKTLIHNLADVVVAVNSRDPYKIGSGLLNISKVVGPMDKAKFYEELGAFIEPYYNTGLGSIDLEEMALKIVDLCRRNHLQMNPDVSLLMKAFGTLEGVVQQLDPDISMLEVARPFTRAYVLKNVNFRNELEDRLLDAYQLTKDIPQVTSRLKAALDALERGRLKVGVDFGHRDQVLDRIESMVNRIVIGLILAALIVGSSLLVQEKDSHTWISQLGIAGYIVAAIFIVTFLASSMWHRLSRWRRKK
ncbi:AarF/ABC1/UbiB kinase family protein [Lactobacillus sp. CC-MHH1034]|uniref:ABC1 kinase family protein n=1 Tax=Agrilactobacillus fermenti TaxID=2586909 RepID=UPI001E34030F|nr:AarF/UbiB family protein [Agrilactobacillus fermenti]MCD2255737.1 AarF/ABC1/UbiB kinase family protein [Agrilactobacillus fermenti]